MRKPETDQDQSTRQAGGKQQGAEDRAAAVRRHLSLATRLLEGLEEDLAVRIRLMEQHQADAERYEQLASLNAEHAKAIENLVEFLARAGTA